MWNFFITITKEVSVAYHIWKKLLKESYSYEKWYATLLQKSETLRDIYVQNLKEYQDVIGFVTAHPDSLSEEVLTQLLTHVDFFINEGFHDYGVTVPVLYAMQPYWEEKGLPGKNMDCHFFLGVSLGESHYFKEACDEFTKALSK